MEYSQMLDRVYSMLPEQTKKHERFEIPKSESFIQGTKTIVRNFSVILKIINREPKHLFKYLSKEAATSGTIDENGRLTLNGKFSEQQVNELLSTYIKQFILCPVCNRPDTKVTEKQGVRMLKCEACGAISSIAGL